MPFCDRGIEQRKTALRRVEMELDEADEMVRTPPTALQCSPAITILTTLSPRSPKWKSNSKACLNPSSPNTRPELNPQRPT